jgi:DMSO reductase anchor subunit
VHPAYSVILFTTASGAGYGLLVWLLVLGAFGLVPIRAGLGLLGYGLAFLLVTVGLLSSTFHLGRPERAWRAFSQWRTSWLSREGVVAVATYVPSGVVALAWVFFETMSGPLPLLAIAGAVLALVTVWCTGMIYASLPTIRAWALPHVAPIYIALALGTGGVLALFVFTLSGVLTSWMPWIAILPLVSAWLLKAAHWERIDTEARTLTAESATGLGRFGKVRPLDPPHTQANYVMREMGYEIARKHAEKLRRVVAMLLFMVPLAAAVLTIAIDGGVLTVPLTLLATLSAAAGVAVERWLFFAEAEHVVMVYYGRDAA